MWQELKHDFYNMEFDIANKNGNRIRSVFCKNKRFVYHTPHKLCDPPSTFEEIFNRLLPYFNKYIKEYQDYKIQRSPISNSIFRIIIFYSKEQKAIDYHHGKILYEIEIDNINKNKLKYEYKNLNLIDNDKEKILSFYITIEKDPRIEDVCVVCHRNKPNVLITKCFHLVACTDCFRLNCLSCCPRCHKPFADIHKVTFAVSRK